MKKKILSCTMAFVMSASLAASFAPTTAVQAKSKVVDVTMFNSDGNADTMSNWHDPISKILTDKTGVKITQSFPVGDVNQKVAVMLASGKLPDLMYVKDQQTKFITAKKFIDLKPLIEKYGPNIKKLYGQYYKRLTINDPKNKAIYVLPTYGVDGKNLTDPGQFQVQAAVLKDQKYPLLNTLDKFEAAIKRYYKKHPKIKGQDTIPISLDTDDWYIYISMCDTATATGGVSGDGNWIIDKNGNCKVTFTSSVHHTFFKWLNKMYNEGLVDKESFVQKTDQWKAKMSSGRVLSTFGAWWMFGECQAALRKSQPERAFIPQPVVAKAGIKEVELRPNGFNPGYGIGITTSASKEHAIAAIKLINYMCSEEAQILTHWGIKGKNYSIVNGKRERSAAELKASSSDKYYGKKTGVGQYTYPFPIYGDGVKDSKGDYYTTTNLYSQADSYGSAEKEAAKAYKVTVFRQLFPAEETIPQSKWGAAWQASLPTTDPTTVVQKKLEDLMKHYLPELVMAKPSEYEGIWKQYVKDVKDAGQTKYEKAFSKVIKERIKLLGN